MYYKMTVNKKIKTINNKIKHNKARYNSDRKTAKISALSSRNVIKYGTLTGEEVIPKRRLLEKVVTIKTFAYSSLGSNMKKQADVAKNNIKD